MVTCAYFKIIIETCTHTHTQNVPVHCNEKGGTGKEEGKQNETNEIGHNEERDKNLLV